MDNMHPTDDRDNKWRLRSKKALAASKAKRRLKPRYDIPTLDASPHMDGYATLAESQNDKDGTVVWNYGGGKNSTAGIIDNINQGLRIDHIIFADTGNEKPETLAFLQIFQRQFLDKHNLKIQIVRNTKWDSLLHNCMTKKIIPALTTRRFVGSFCIYLWSRFFKSYVLFAVLKSYIHAVIAIHNVVFTNK